MFFWWAPGLVFKLCGEQKQDQARLSPTGSQQWREIADIYCGWEKIPVWAGKFGKFTLDIFQSEDGISLGWSSGRCVWMLRSINQAEYFVFERTCGINDTVVPGPPLPVCAAGASAGSQPQSPLIQEKVNQPFLFQGNLHGSISDSMFRRLLHCIGWCLHWLSGTTSEPLVKSVFVHLDIWEENQYRFCSDLAG